VSGPEGPVPSAQGSGATPRDDPCPDRAGLEHAEQCGRDGNAAQARYGVSLHLFERGLEVLGGDLSELDQGSRRERVLCRALDLTRQALSGLEQHLDGRRLE